MRFSDQTMYEFATVSSMHMQLISGKAQGLQLAAFNLAMDDFENTDRQRKSRKFSGQCKTCKLDWSIFVENPRLRQEVDK